MSTCAKFWLHTLLRRPASPPPSPFDWGRPEWLQETLGNAFELGFERGTLYHRVPDGGVAWDFMAESFGPVYAVANGLDEETPSIGQDRDGRAVRPT